MRIPCLRLCLFASLLFSGTEINAADAVYEVTITNRAKSSLTSIVWATHGNQARFFQRGKKASPGLAELAKDGGTNLAKKELKRQSKGGRGVHSVGVAFGPGAGRTTTFRVRADERRPFLSWATMAVCSNDTFAGQSRYRLPQRLNHTRRKQVLAYDAGAEVNTETSSDVPCLGGHGVGEEENGVVHLSNAIRGDADLRRSRGWGNYIATIRVRRIR
ncbi:MAG: spondin domain-containing protein [Verrucomicrobiales bacterium]|nr:spondin domain-containing protein [Verrucomicrobiales bacterium]